MKASPFRSIAISAVLTQDSQALLAIIVASAVLAALVYAGIALPAIWSAKPARRQAATSILCKILDTLRRK
jgi:hypothetical protein